MVVGQIADLLDNTQSENEAGVQEPDRGQRCGDIELESYLENEEGPVSSVLDLLLRYPNDLDW